VHADGVILGRVFPSLDAKEADRGDTVMYDATPSADSVLGGRTHTLWSSGTSVPTAP
jgi:hypothetical protein